MIVVGHGCVTNRMSIVANLGWWQKPNLFCVHCRLTSPSVCCLAPVFREREIKQLQAWLGTVEGLAGKFSELMEAAKAGEAESEAQEEQQQRELESGESWGTRLVLVVGCG